MVRRSYGAAGSDARCNQRGCPLNATAAGGGDDIWEGALLVPSGTHRFNLLVDGEWVVPHGVATLTDELGGLVALLVVP